MAGRGPAPKPAELRARTNKKATEAVLEPPKYKRRAIPKLHRNDLHENVVKWWNTIWKSPMAAQYLEADIVGGLYVLADLYDLRWKATTPAQMLEAAREIRHQERRFGLTPIDRASLGWNMREDVPTPAKQADKTPAADKRPPEDPRAVLTVVR